MLVLSRKEGETIDFPEVDVQIRVLGLRKSKVQIGIEAPPHITVRRGEQPRVPKTDSDEQQQALAELVRLEADITALAELASKSNCDQADEVCQAATKRLNGIRRSIRLRERCEPHPISELVTVRTDVIDRLRLAPPSDGRAADCVRQSNASYEISRACGVA